MKYKALKDIATITMGQSPNSSSYNEEKNGMPFYQGNADFGELYPTARVWCSNPKKIAKENDILISVRAPIGALNYATEECCIGRGLAAITIENDAERNYVFHFLKAQNKELNNKGTGSTFKAISKSVLEEVQVPVISKEQQEISMKLMDIIEQIIHQRKQELQRLDELIQARFVEMFGDPVSNTKGWKRVIIDECVDSIENGKSFVCDSMARIGEEPAILKLSAATYGVYKPEENKAIINESDFIEGAEVHSGDLLFTRKNTPELVGMAAYVFMTPKKLMMPDLIFRINTKQNCRKIYLWKLINHELFRSQIQNLASGSAKSMSNISKERLGKLHICLPPLDLQIEFEKFVVQINKSKVAVQKALDETQLLFDSLMQKYFG